ncbi:MAG TPA: TIGR03086 family metal-binding protein [Acidimicrobiales bacterium]|nr:TIGR03086 family metal-binding protein [Acidimicrobiales bacterium]
MTNDTLSPEAPVRELLADPRPALLSALGTCGDLIHVIGPDELDRPTPCAEMDVRALLGHLVMVAQRIACAARLVPTHLWPTDVTGLADDEWAPAWHEAAIDAVAAWSDDALLDQVTALPWATMPGRDVVGIYTNEVVVHGWDLGQGTGRVPAWGDLALDTALHAIHQQLPDADRGPMWAEVQAGLPEGIPWQDPFANAVPVPDDAPVIDRVVAWNGRRP